MRPYTGGLASTCAPHDLAIPFEVVRCTFYLESNLHTGVPGLPLSLLRQAGRAALLNVAHKRHRGTFVSCLEYFAHRRVDIA